MGDPHDDPVEARIAAIQWRFHEKGMRLVLTRPDVEAEVWHALAVTADRHNAEPAVGTSRLEAAEAALRRLEG